MNFKVISLVSMPMPKGDLYPILDQSRVVQAHKDEALAIYGDYFQMLLRAKPAFDAGEVSTRGCCGPAFFRTVAMQPFHPFHYATYNFYPNDISNLMTAREKYLAYTKSPEFNEDQFLPEELFREFDVRQEEGKVVCDNWGMIASGTNYEFWLSLAFAMVDQWEKTNSEAMGVASYHTKHLDSEAEEASENRSPNKRRRVEESEKDEPDTNGHLVGLHRKNKDIIFEDRRLDCLHDQRHLQAYQGVVVAYGIVMKPHHVPYFLAQYLLDLQTHLLKLRTPVYKVQSSYFSKSA